MHDNISNNSAIRSVNLTMNFLNAVVNSEEPDNVFIAASDGNLDAVKQFVESGINVNSQDETGYSPL